MRKQGLISIIIMILFLINCANALEISIYKRKNNIEKAKINIDPITPKNDAFHGKKMFPSYEWWYFDAVFDKNYGIHVGIKVLTFGKWGYLQQLVNIYNNSKIEENAVVTKPIKQFKISREYPDIWINNQQLLKFDYKEYNKTGNWKYTIDVNVEKININLTFIGKSKGFTYTTSHEGWTVAQPKADVFGTIKLENKKINVIGEGYHDHNWNFSLKTGIRATGWYWGKIVSPNFSLTWAKIKKTRFADETIAENLGILSALDKGFVVIDSENISFTKSNNTFDTSRFIPTKFSLYAKQGDVEINVSFNSVNIQHTKPDFFTINYWRYFISITGYIKLGNEIDYLKDDIQIMEFMRFI